MNELLIRHFKTKLTKEELFVKGSLLFSDLLRLEVGNKEYEEIKDLKKLNNFLEEKLENYNSDC